MKIRINITLSEENYAFAKKKSIKISPLIDRMLNEMRLQDEHQKTD